MFPVFFCLSLEKVDSQNQQLCGDTIVLCDLEYRTIRFGISYYTILNIVLYDLEYRTIRFGISYYTIRNIVLYDSVNRCPVQPNPGDGVGRGLLQPANHPSRCPWPCRWMFVTATSVTPADGASDWPRCGC